MFKSYKKGQLFSLDLVLSIVVFFVLFLFMLSLWHLYTVRLAHRLDSEELQLAAFDISELMVKSSGVPSNWESDPSTVQVLGLSNAPGALDEKKLAAFLAMDYNASKQVYNIERFEYSLKIISPNGSITEQAGKEPDDSVKESISVTRIVLVGEDTSTMQVILWES